MIRISYLKSYRDNTLVPLTKQFAVDNKNSALGVYFDFDPGLPKNLGADDHTYGVWYLDKKLNGSIERNDMEFKKNFYPDNKNMAWYYNAVKAKTGVWSKPYIDIYTGYYMISYNVPLYYGDQLIGVAGIDMTFESVKNMIEKFKVLDTGYAFLLSGDYGHHRQSDAERDQQKHKIDRTESGLSKIDRRDQKRHL